MVAAIQNIDKSNTAQGREFNKNIQKKMENEDIHEKFMQLATDRISGIIRKTEAECNPD